MGLYNCIAINAHSPNTGTHTNHISINTNNSITSNNTNSTKNTENNVDPDLIWIDYNINNEENTLYQQQLNKILSFKGFTTIIDGINEIKKIKFKKVMLMLTSRIFYDFIPLFETEKNQIFCCLNVIVFTKTEKIQEIEKFCEERISSGYLFDTTNIFDDFEKIKDFIKKVQKKHIKFTENLDIIHKDNQIYFDQKIDNFEKINNYEELILPIYFHQSIEPITREEIRNFNYFLLTLYDGKNETIKNLIDQFDNIPDMPIEIICKYWAYIYSLEGKIRKQNFYYILNAGLREKYYKLFLPFIKMMYEGLKRKVFLPVKNQELYSGGVISNKELQKIKDNLNNNSNNNNLPKVIYYIRAFKSFSKKKEVSEGFINKSSKDSTGLLFIVLANENNNNIEDEFVSNAYIKEFSAFGDKEDEVLFFPFSSFEVVNIEDNVTDTKKYVIISLKYLGRYKRYIEENKSSEIIMRDIPISQFGRDITEIGLINYKFSKYWKVEKEIITNGKANSIIVINKNKILFSLGNQLNLYDLQNNQNIHNIFFTKEINDLNQINENTIFLSSKDKTIKVIKLTDNLSNINVVKSLEFHSAEVNQTIKLIKKNHYASCSKDKTIKLWIYNSENNDSEIKHIISDNYEVLTIYELPTSNIISISKDEFLTFWGDTNNSILPISLKGFKNPLHNCIFLLSEVTILIGTKKELFVIDINRKQKIKRFTLNYNACSIHYINGNIFLGLKNSKDSCLLFEYIIDKKYGEMSLECIGKGIDLFSEISFITSLDDKTMITCNKPKNIKIWKETENKPNLLLFNNLPSSNLAEGYESEKEIPGENETPGNDYIFNNEINNIFIDPMKQMNQMFPIGMEQNYMNNSMINPQFGNNIMNMQQQSINQNDMIYPMMNQNNFQMGQMNQMSPMMNLNNTQMMNTMNPMFQQQLMQQQMAQQTTQQQKMQIMQNILNGKSNQEENFTSPNSYFQPHKLSVLFRGDGITSSMIQCLPEDKISSLIDKYRNKTGDKDETKKFLFNAKSLNPNLSVAEVGIYEGANIFVIKTKQVQNSKVENIEEKEKEDDKNEKEDEDEEEEKEYKNDEKDDCDDEDEDERDI